MDEDTEFDTPLNVYAGFWLRLCAFCTDFFILSMVLFFFLFNLEYFGQLRFPYPLTLTFILNWLYFAIMESSPYQATLGKMAMGIRVVDINFQRLSFARASARWFCKFFSIAICGIGFLLILLTPKQQALHDIMTGSLVVID